MWGSKAAQGKRDVDYHPILQRELHLHSSKPWVSSHTMFNENTAGVKREN